MPKKRSLDEVPAASSSKKLCASQESCSQNTSEKEVEKCGKLIRMKLINFMCHKNLVVNFNKYINVIIGNNGSGKSAILAALVVGLGSSARITNRSTNIKQLIRNGENAATIEIDIANNNSDAYDHETFGDKITVVRHININGTSQYKIKNSNGRIIYKTCEQLQKILFYLNIQIDNPVVVLNQDNARSFLRNLDPSKNYQLFLRATQIETIQDKLDQCKNIAKDYKLHLNYMKTELEVLEKEVSTLQEKYNSLRSADNLKADVEQYKLERVWLAFIQQEEIVENLKIEIERISDEQKKYENIVKNKNAIENEYNTKILNLEEQLKKSIDSLHKQSQKLKNLKTEYEKEVEKLQIEERNCQKIKDRIYNYEQQIKTLKETISDRSNSSQINELQEENERKICEYEAQLKELEAMIINLKREYDLIEVTKQQHENKFEELKNRRQRTIHNNENIQKQLKVINASQKNALSVYGEDIDKLILSIERANMNGKFSEMPKGPLGRYIEVIDKKWQNIIENLLMSCMHLFLVSTKDDRMVLDKIVKDEFPRLKIRIVTNRFCHKVYNVEKGMVHPPPGTRLLLDEIRCSDPVVMNCLIDRAHIESILLVENQALASKLTSHTNNVPHNLQKIILLDPPIEYFPAPLRRTYSLEIRQSRFLQVNIDQRIKQMENEFENNQIQIKNIENELKQMQQILKDTYIREQKIRKKLEDHEISKHNIETNLEELKSNEFVSNEDEIRILNIELNEFQTKLDSLNENLNEKQELLQNYLESKKSKKKLCDEEEQRINSLNNEFTTIKNEIDKIKEELNTKLFNIQATQQRNTSLLAELKDKKKNYENELNNLRSLRQIAEKEGEYAETSKTEKELTELIKILEIKIDRARAFANNVKIEDIKALLDDKKSELEKQRTLINEFNKTAKMLIKSVYERFSIVKSLKDLMSYRVKYAFDSILKLRGFVGEIVIDHKNHILDITVIPRDNQIRNAVSNTKSLSGGERSYSTVAFLLSLWSCIDHPFYFLDEYDVFTDQLNRQFINKLLLNEAKKKKNCQHVFLTPQDMSFITASDLISIHRMSDPREE